MTKKKTAETSLRLPTPEQIAYTFGIPRIEIISIIESSELAITIIFDDMNEYIHSMEQKLKDKNIHCEASNCQCVNGKWYTVPPFIKIHREDVQTFLQEIKTAPELNGGPFYVLDVKIPEQNKAYFKYPYTSDAMEPLLFCLFNSNPNNTSFTHLQYEENLKLEDIKEIVGKVSKYQRVDSFQVAQDKAKELHQLANDWNQRSIHNPNDDHVFFILETSSLLENCDTVKCAYLFSGMGLIKIRTPEQFNTEVLKQKIVSYPPPIVSPQLSNDASKALIVINKYIDLLQNEQKTHWKVSMFGHLGNYKLKKMYALRSKIMVNPNKDWHDFLREMDQTSWFLGAGTSHRARNLINNLLQDNFDFELDAEPPSVPPARLYEG